MKGHHEDYCQLQQSYSDAKEQWYKDKDTLKKGTKQLKEKVVHAQSRIDNLTEQLHDVVSKIPCQLCVCVTHVRIEDLQCHKLYNGS